MSPSIPLPRWPQALQASLLWQQKQPHLPGNGFLTIAKAQGFQPQHQTEKDTPYLGSLPPRKPRLLTEEETGESQELGDPTEMGVF